MAFSQTDSEGRSAGALREIHTSANNTLLRSPRVQQLGYPSVAARSPDAAFATRPGRALSMGSFARVRRRHMDCRAHRRGRTRAYRPCARAAVLAHRNIPSRRPIEISNRYALPARIAGNLLSRCVEQIDVDRQTLPDRDVVRGWMYRDTPRHLHRAHDLQRRARPRYRKHDVWSNALCAHGTILAAHRSARHIIYFTLTISTRCSFSFPTFPGTTASPNCPPACSDATTTVMRCAPSVAISSSEYFLSM